MDDQRYLLFKYGKAKIGGLCRGSLSIRRDEKLSVPKALMT